MYAQLFQNSTALTPAISQVLELTAPSSLYHLRAHYRAIAVNALPSFCTVVQTLGLLFLNCAIVVKTIVLLFFRPFIISCWLKSVKQLHLMPLAVNYHGRRTIAIRPVCKWRSHRTKTTSSVKGTRQSLQLKKCAHLPAETRNIEFSDLYPMSWEGG